MGQVAVVMAFQTALRFPETFLLEKVKGEEPLYVYTIDLADMLTQSEISSGIIQREYQFEKDELKNVLIDCNLSNEDITSIFTTFDQQDRNFKMNDFINSLRSHGARVGDIISFLKNLGIPDQLITRIMGAQNG